MSKKFYYTDCAVFAKFSDAKRRSDLTGSPVTRNNPYGGYAYSPSRGEYELTVNITDRTYDSKKGIIVNQYQDVIRVRAWSEANALRQGDEMGIIIHGLNRSVQAVRAKLIGK